jgi:hypothetical protein
MKQLTLLGIEAADTTLAALMEGPPQLLLLRLLGCPAMSQECCQALVGRLQLYELQVDVVVDDGSGRSAWMMQQLAER